MTRLAAASLALLVLAACGAPRPARRAPPAAPSAAAPPPAPAAPPAAPPQPPGPSAEVLVARARALRAEGDVAGARARLEAALAAAPEDAPARVELADLLVVDGRDLERAAALLAGVPEPGPPGLHLVLARLAEARGDDGWAANEYGLALAEADDPDVRLRRALALERLGRGGEATLELERAREARPGDPLARARLADRYEAEGRMAEAEAELRFLAEGEPERAARWERLARFYERLGRGKDARAAADRARAAVAAGQDERTLRPLPRSRR